MHQVISVDKATELILKTQKPRVETKVSILKSMGQILSQPILADRNLPPYDRVMMDGFAARSESLASGVARFRLVAEQAAGSHGAKISNPDECIEVSTGAPLPYGANVVLPVEWSRRKGEFVQFEFPNNDAIRSWLYVHREASDYVVGTELIPAGTKVGPPEVAVAASCGYSRLDVFKSPSVSIIGTGAELVDIDEKPLPHQIRKSNIYALASTCQSIGVHDLKIETANDEIRVLKKVIRSLEKTSDVLVFSGGVSMGRHDHLPNALMGCGYERIFHGVSQTPGKPMWFGRKPNGAIAFGLPGNPVSALVCFVRYVEPLVRCLLGCPRAIQPVVELDQKIEFEPPLTRFLPVRLKESSGQNPAATPCVPNNSGDLAALSGTDGFVELDAEMKTFRKGFRVRFFSWCP